MKPILLNSALPSNGGNGIGVYDSGRLQNPYRRPMLVDAITFLLKQDQLVVVGTPASSGSGDFSVHAPNKYFAFGSSIGFKVQMGRIELTNGFIPAWLLAQNPNAFNGIPIGPDPSKINAFSQYAYDAPEVTPGIVITYTNAGPPIRAAIAQSIYAQYTWHLPKPLYMPPGAALLVSAQAINSAAAADGSQVSIAGRMLDEPLKAKEFPIPYATAFIAPTNQATSNSSEMDLGNPFQVPLHVQRFTGRIQRAGSGWSAEDRANTKTTVKMETNRNVTIVRDYTPFYDVFDESRRAWNVGVTLDPKERVDAAIAGGSAYADSSTVTPMIGLIGWRNEKVH